MRLLPEPLRPKLPLLRLLPTELLRLLPIELELRLLPIELELRLLPIELELRLLPIELLRPKLPELVARFSTEVERLGVVMLLVFI